MPWHEGVSIFKIVWGAAHAHCQRVGLKLNASRIGVCSAQLAHAHEPRRPHRWRRVRLLPVVRMGGRSAGRPLPQCTILPAQAGAGEGSRRLKVFPPLHHSSPCTYRGQLLGWPQQSFHQDRAPRSLPHPAHQHRGTGHRLLENGDRRGAGHFRRAHSHKDSWFVRPHCGHVQKHTKRAGAGQRTLAKMAHSRAACPQLALLDPPPHVQMARSIASPSQYSSSSR